MEILIRIAIALLLAGLVLKKILKEKKYNSQIAQISRFFSDLEENFKKEKCGLTKESLLKMVRSGLLQNLPETDVKYTVSMYEGTLLQCDGKIPNLPLETMADNLWLPDERIFRDLNSKQHVILRIKTPHCDETMRFEIPS
jgi:hypothetical protein